MSNISSSGPQFFGSDNNDLRQWAWKVRLPWLVETLGLAAGVLCDSIDEDLRRKVYGLNKADELPNAVDWSQNGVIISPPGTGKGVAIFAAALEKFESVYVLVPSVLQAHKLEESLDTLYHKDLGGCMTSQRRSPGLINVITTGMFHMLVQDQTSDIWKKNCCLFVDECQRIFEGDPLTEFFVGHIASMGFPVFAVSATIAPGRLPEVIGEPASPAVVYELYRQMHPIKVQVLNMDWDSFIETTAPAYANVSGTILIFCYSRRGVQKVCETIQKAGSRAIAITGAHEVEAQLREIEQVQASGESVVVVATPGTADSSVTIPGLTSVVIQDQRIMVDYNEFGVRERRHESLPVNHIVQMIRRVGRLKRADGGLDEVFIVSDVSRPELENSEYEFTPLEGCPGTTPIEQLLLQAAVWDVPFSDIHDFMLSNFSEEYIFATRQKLLEDGMFVEVDLEEDADGLELTELGRMVLAIPFDYKWSCMIAECPEHLRLFVTLAASFGRLADLESFESEFVVPGHPKSELLRKVKLGLNYVSLEYDNVQRHEAAEMGMSFRRLETVEQLFRIGCEAAGIEWQASNLPELTPDIEEELIRWFVEGGLRTGLFQLYLPSEGRKGWSDLQRTSDGKLRRFFLDKGTLQRRYAVDGILPIVAETVWFTSRNGNDMANLDNATIIPQDMVAEIVEEEAKQQGWMKLTFEQGRRGLKSQNGWNGIFIPSRFDNEPVVGRSYWCSIDREIAWGVTAVIVHYPVM